MDAFDKLIKLRLRFRGQDPSVLSDFKQDFYRDRIAEILGVVLPNSADHISSLEKAEFDRTIGELGVKIATLRTAFNPDSKLLKPVATFPMEQLELAEGLAYQHSPQEFSGRFDALDGIPNRWPIDSPEVIDNGRAIHFTAAHKTNGDPPAALEGNNFSNRIDIAFEDMREKSKGDLGESSICLFSVIARQKKTKVTSARETAKEKKIENDTFLISQILAIYVDADTELTTTQISAVHKLSRELFDESDQIRQIDDELFELEGHELTSRLQPLFLDEKIAPADKISFAIESLKNLVNRHLSSHFPCTEKNKPDPQVYFVSLAYEILNKDNPSHLLPTFQVYPHTYRKQYPFGSFIIGHPKKSSVSKYLLRNYFRWHQHNLEEGHDQAREFIVAPSGLYSDQPTPVSIQNEFMLDLLDEADEAIESSTRQDELTSIRDMIFLSKELNRDGRELVEDPVWDYLNVNVRTAKNPTELHDESEQVWTVSRGNNSIIAYVVEGHDFQKRLASGEEKVFRQLPRAILAIEGNQHELLSDRERKSLRVVAVAFSHLVRHLFHENSLLDYRPQLSRAYDEYADTIGTAQGKDLATRFILASMSVDVALLKLIQKAARDTKAISKDTCDKVDEIYQEVFSGTEIDDEKVKEAEIVKDRISQRFRGAIKFVQNQNPSTLTPDVIDFIEACPRNFAWAGYAPSLAQALGDRADHKPPKFELMSPGYSASGLYMALVESEIRQVAKLSSVSKLRQERDNYRQYVRYKVLAAARTPVNAFAFDSTGEDGKKSFLKGDGTDFRPDLNYEDRCYGVLVSDLASARKLEPKGSGDAASDKVETFLGKLCAVIQEEDRTQVSLIVDAIKNFFGDNLGHWYSTPTADDLRDKTTIGILHDGFRLNYEEKERKHRDRVGDKVHESARLPTRDNWVEEIFSRLISGDSQSDVSYESSPFHFSQHALDVEKIAALHGHRYGNKIPFTAVDGSSDLLSVAHRDLNARNLVWAGPIKNLVMIDFEHVGIGFWGMDQARLALSTVVEFLSEVEFDNLEAPTREILAVENAAQFLIDLWDTYNTAKLTKKGPHFPNDWQSNLEQSLRGVIIHIVRTSWSLDPRAMDKKYFGIFRACLGFAAIKEYEYGLINLRRETLNSGELAAVDSLLEKGGTLKKKLKSLYSSGAFDRDNTQAVQRLAAVSRFVISSHILGEVLKRIKTQEIEETAK